jgi:heptosyltransferase II
MAVNWRLKGKEDRSLYAAEFNRHIDSWLAAERQGLRCRARRGTGPAQAGPAAVKPETGGTLVVGPSWVGDMVMANALLRMLAARRRGPIDVVAPGWSQPLLQRMREVREGHLLEAGHGELAMGARRRLARELRERKYAQAIVLPRSFKAALVPWLARIPRRTGMRGEFRYGLINDMRPVEWTRSKPMVERLCVLGLDPGEALPGPLPEPRLRVDAGEQQRLMERLGLSVSAPVAALLPGAEHGPAKRWPAPYFAELARRFRDEGFSVWLLGSPKDHATGEEIADASHGAATNLCGRTALVDAIDLLGAARVAVSNDSGLLHIASAVGTPVVGLYGSSSPVYTPPLTARREILYLDLYCSPCFEKECPLGHFRCMREITPAMALEAAMRLL